MDDSVIIIIIKVLKKYQHFIVDILKIYIIKIHYLKWFSRDIQSMTSATAPLVDTMRPWKSWVTLIIPGTYHQNRYLLYSRIKTLKSISKKLTSPQQHFRRYSGFKFPAEVVFSLATLLNSSITPLAVETETLQTTIINENHSNNTTIIPILS